MECLSNADTDDELPQLAGVANKSPEVPGSIMRTGFFAFVPAATAALLCSAMACAAALPVDASNGASKLSQGQRDERAFIRTAAAIGRFDADASKLAIARASDEGVRAVARDRISHYNETGIELQRFLHVRGMALPMLDNGHRKILNRLGKLSGRRFDQDYLEQVGLKHQREDIRHFENASLSVTDPVLKAWIDRQLPALRNQLVAAERIAIPGVKPVVPARAAASSRQTRAEPVKISASSSR